MASAVGTGAPGGSRAGQCAGSDYETQPFRIEGVRRLVRCIPPTLVHEPTPEDGAAIKSRASPPGWTQPLRVDRRLRGINETATSVDSFDAFARDARARL